jgi:hypothetical protein
MRHDWLDMIDLMIPTTNRATIRIDRSSITR